MWQEAKKEDELERVLYAVFRPYAAIFGLFRLAGALAGDSDEAVATYLSLDAQPHGLASPSQEYRSKWIVRETDREYLRRAQLYLEQVNRLDQAAALFRIRFALDKGVYAEKPELEQKLQTAGKGGLVELIHKPILAAVEPSMVSITLDAAKKTDFFTWFHLKETGGEHAGSELDFKPSGLPFTIWST